MAIEVSGAELKYIYDLDALLARPNSKKERMYQHSWAQDIYALLVEEAAKTLEQFQEEFGTLKYF